MSEYAYVEGTYQFSSESDLDKTIEQMDSWIDSDWVSRSDLTITIPFDSYRNLHRHIETYGSNASEYHIVGACTDGAFYGFTATTDDGYVEVDLELWAEKNGFEQPPETETADSFDEYVEWQENILHSFIEEHF